jgi:hypothetical protein
MNDPSPPASRQPAENDSGFIGNFRLDVMRGDMIRLISDPSTIAQDQNLAFNDELDKELAQNKAKEEARVEQAQPQQQSQEPSDDDEPNSKRSKLHHRRRELPKEELQFADEKDMDEELSLAKTNPHPRDKRIKFKNEGHFYVLDWLMMLPSVTSILSTMFHEFDESKTIDKMLTRRNKLEYNAKYTALWAMQDLDFEYLSNDDIKQLLFDDWEDNRAWASKKGTIMHRKIELTVNDVYPPHHFKDKAMQHFYRFEEEFIKPRGWVRYRAEWTIYDEDDLFAGCIDMVYYDPVTGLYHLVDWKNSKLITEEGYGEHGKGPLSAIPSANRFKYNFQLNFYQHVFEKNYGKTIDSRWIAVMYEDNPSYLLFEVPNLQVKTRECLAYFKKHRQPVQPYTMTPEEVQKYGPHPNGLLTIPLSLSEVKIDIFEI